jgi:hydrogenase expression/formation protein HypC
MCLAVPGKVVAIDHDAEPLMGTVDFSGVQKQICLDWVPDVKEGDYVIVHVGFALNTLDEQEALETLRLLNEMQALGDETGDPDEPADDGEDDGDDGEQS